MDSSTQSLLDLLNKSSAAKKTSEKDHLLALLGQKSSENPPSMAAVPSPSNRNGNANELLAALMGSTTPKAPESTASADLLTSLMGSAQSSYSVATPSKAHNDSVYLNPRHEYLTKTTPSQSEKSTEVPSAITLSPRPFFSTSNPFDELERIHTSQLKTRNAEHDNAQQKGQTQHGSEPKEQASSSVPTHNTILQRDLSKSSVDTSLDESHEKPDAAPQTTTKDEQHRLARSSTETPKRNAAHAAQPTNRMTAIALPHESSSVFKLTGSKLHPGDLDMATPITKMMVKADPLNRSIISASHKYIVYPLIKDGASGHIRVVDQDTGETIVLSQHSSKVVSLTLAKVEDGDGRNALMSVDIDSNVIVWAITSTTKIEKIFEIAGPSDTSHKARTSWNQDGSYFGVSITSRLYVFDYRSLLAAPRANKVKLNPEMKQAVCILKADKAIRGFAFSPDSTSVAALDKAGNVKLWILESTGKDISAAATIVLGEKSLSSIYFVSERHLVVSVTAGSSFILVDIKAAKGAQELRLASADANQQLPVGSKSTYVVNKQHLLVQDTVLRRLYLIQLSLPARQDAKTGSIIANLSSQASHLDATGAFKTVSAFQCKDEGDWLDFACVPNLDNYEVLIAHSKGYAMYSIAESTLVAAESQAQALESVFVSRMQNLGHIATSDEQTVEIASKTPTAPVDAEKQSTSTGKSSKKTIRNAEQQTNAALVTEPRTAEMAAKIEANLRASITSELQKGNATLAAQIDKMQKASDAKHETVLRLISETLSKNTTQVLQTAISEAIEKSVLPTMEKTVEAAVTGHIKTSLSTCLEAALTGDLADATHAAVQKAFESAGIVGQLEAAAASMTNDLGARHKHMEQSLAGALVRLDAQILERQKTDSDKIDQLLAAVGALERQVTQLKAAAEFSDRSRPAIAPPIPQGTSAMSAPFPPRPMPPPPPQQSASLPEDYTKYHELIMNFVSKSQRIAAGDYEGVPYIRQFLSWQPEARTKDEICKSLASDQLQILAFTHALASQLTEEDAFNRVHWIGSALKFLSVSQDARLSTLGPQLLSVIHVNLTKTLERAPAGSQYRHLVEAVLGQMGNSR